MAGIARIKNLKSLTPVQNLVWEAYKFGCQNPRDVNHPDTPVVFAAWYVNIFKNAEDEE